MSTNSFSLDPNSNLRTLIYQNGAAVGVYAPEDYPESPDNEIPIRKKRRMQGDGWYQEDPRQAMTLTEMDGVLRWRDGYGYRRPSGPRRARRSFNAEGNIVAPINFEKLEPSKIGEYLRSFDLKLTPSCHFDNPELGLRQFVDGAWQNPGVKPVTKGQILLFIHGTFSNSEMFLSELNRTPEGCELIKKIQRKKNYDQVLAFDHATLSVSPVLNAIDLARIFADSEADIDIICHSRGGLVTRWWLERFLSAQNRRLRAVLVGSPLAGTSLASAPRLRAAVDLLTNIAHVLEKAGTLASATFPFFTVITGLLRVVASAGMIAAKTPIFDATVALVPGLLGQAKVSNSEELNRLNRDCKIIPTYFAVLSDFEPTSPGWEFWKYFVNVGDRVKDVAADLVFEGPNDLVVDTSSMRVLAVLPQAIFINDVYDFGKTDRVHHTVYFRQPETVGFISQCLGL